MPPYNRYTSGTTVSRDLAPGERSWDGLVFQSGKPVLDAELNLIQSAADYQRFLRGSGESSSGWVMRGPGREVFSEYTFLAASSGNENKFRVRRGVAVVAGMAIAVEYTATTTPDVNVIELPAATAAAGSAPDVKRTDFVFLEVWRAVVAPSPRAAGTVQINDPQTLVAAETVTVDATAVGGPAVTFVARASPSLATEFALGGSATSSAAALAAAINNPANGLYPNYVAARTGGTHVVTVTATFGGTTGNNITLATNAPSHVTLSGGTLTGGANRGNKPSQSTLYRHGNVLAPSGVALADDLVDPILATETAQRIQIQYRLRAYASTMPGGVNPKTQPDGFSNGALYAQGTQTAGVSGYPFVPADGVTVASSSSAAAYGVVDAGLWVAGDGSSGAATALGTADGFVYAIPVCFVFRRNNATASGGFNPGGNVNGALSFGHGGFSNTNLPGGPYTIAATKSDRPDGLFHDQIVATDVLDLRRYRLPAGFDLSSELQYQVQSLLDGSLDTWAVDGSDLGGVGNGSGDQSVRPISCDEIGRTDTTAGDLVRKFDHIARRFGAQSVVERMVFQVLPNTAIAGLTVTKASGTHWHEGDLISIDFDALNPTTLQNWTTPDVGPAVVSAYWPTGTRVTDVISAYHDDGHSTTPVNQAVQWARIEGIGTNRVDLYLDANSSVVNDGGTQSDHPMIGTTSDDGSTRRIFVEVEITYPTGSGLTRTPEAPLTPSASSGYAPYDGGALVEADPTQRPPEMRGTWTPRPRFRSGYREVLLEQQSATALGSAVTDSLITLNGNTVRLPRRVSTLTGCVANGVAAAAATLGSSERLVTLASGAVVSNQTLIAVAYYPQDPIPSAGTSGYQVDVYYRSKAPQTAGTQSGALPTALLPTTLRVTPWAVSSSVWTGQTGKGSPHLSFPYASPLDAIVSVPVGGGPYPGSVPKEWYFSANAEVFLRDFNAETGYLTLNGLVQVDGSATLQLGDTGRGPAKDGEFRAYYDLANPSGYKPLAAAPPLFGVARHKTWTAYLVTSQTDTRLFRRGELLLMVVSRVAELDAANTVAFTDTPAIRTAAALYRTKNLLLMGL